MMPGLSQEANGYLVGVISDTHGLLRPAAIDALKGSNMIIHAGDVGSPEILAALQTLAPVMAVRGNMDRGEWAHQLPETEVVEVGEVLLHVLHDVGEMYLDPAAAGFHAVISGHSHQPSVSTRDGVLFLNPGSAGPRRLRSPVTLALLRVLGTSLDARVVDLEG